MRNIWKFISGPVGMLLFLFFILTWAATEFLYEKGVLSQESLSRLSLGAGYIGSMLIFFFTEWKQERLESRQIDKENFETFLKKMPSTTAIYCLETHWFEKSFNTQYFHELVDFDEFYERPGRLFSDRELRKDFERLRATIKQCIEKMAAYTTPVTDKMSGFPVDLEMTNRKLFQERAKELNDASKAAAEAYHRFVNTWSVVLKIKH